ncbi:flagellar filament capping protein FliD [Rheinheimera sp.]|uniref:flagellar filament capping protein FliD n=1 Tax=Rheinheimera sp. TaxID=1869214 RepID=UPI00307CF3CF
MATITNAGVGSGLDLESIISATLQAEYQPKAQRISTQESSLKVQLTGLGAIKSVLAKLQDVVEGLAKTSVFENRTATLRQPENATSEGDLISVTTSTTATPGAFKVSVDQLASGSRAISSAGNTFSSSSDVVSASGGTLTFEAGDQSFSIDVAAGATLEDVRQAVNKSKNNFGISVNIINTGTESQLVITSNKTGAGNDLKITSNTAELDKLSTEAFGGGAGGVAIAVADQAKDAIISVDGIQITSDTNTFKDAVQGLTIKAERESLSGETAKATIDYDRTGVTTKIDEFITAYNNAIETINQQSLLVSAPLYGDSTVRAIKDQLINTLSTVVSGAGDYESIFDIGLSLNGSNKLEKNSVVRTLNEALDENFADVGSLFTNVGGIAKSFETLLAGYVDSSGVIKDRQDDINVELRDLEDDKENLDYRMTTMEANLRKKYSALDVLIAQMNSTNNYLTSQLASLSRNTK